MFTYWCFQFSNFHWWWNVCVHVVINRPIPTHWSSAENEYMTCSWLSSKCLSFVKSQANFFYLPAVQVCCPPTVHMRTTSINQNWEKFSSESAQQRWIEAESDLCLGWLETKRHRLLQTSLCVCLRWVIDWLSLECHSGHTKCRSVHGSGKPHGNPIPMGISWEWDSPFPWEWEQPYGSWWEWE